MRVTVCIAVLAATVAACEGNGTLVLSVRTDLAPGLQMDRVVAEVSTPEGVSEGRFEVLAGASREWGIGVRVVERALPPGRHRARVAALDAAGAVIVERPVTFDIGSGVQQVTVWLTQDCAGVECPATDPALNACLAGRCVEERCVEEAAASCGPPACTGDGDCGPAPAGACANRECTPSGACVDVLDHASCAAEAICDIDRGCVEPALSPLSPPSDAGHAHVIALYEDGTRAHRVELRPGAPAEDLTAHLDASGAVPRNPGSIEDGPIGFSRDGARMVLVARRGGCDDCVIVAPIADLSRAEIIPVLAAPSLGLETIDGAGTRVVYTTPEVHLARVDRVGGAWTPAPGLLDEGSGHAFGFDPTLTPDEVRVIFVCGDDAIEPGRAAAICEVSVEGGPVTERVAAGALGPDRILSVPRETTDGALVFETNDAGTVEVWRVPPASAIPAPAPRDLVEAENLCELPDGRIIGRVTLDAIEVFQADGTYIESVDVGFPGAFTWFIDACSR